MDITIIKTTSHGYYNYYILLQKGGTNPLVASYIQRVALRGVPVLENSYAFNGFARAGGIDMTEDGIVGTLCAKLWHRGAVICPC